MTKRKKNTTKENKRAKEAYPVVISSVRLFITSNNLWSHPTIQQRKDLTFENSPKRLQSTELHLDPSHKTMLDAVFLPFLSRQLNDCMCFLIYCTFFDYVQDSFKRMTSISDSWAQLFEGRLALNLGLNLTRVSFSFIQKHFLR